MSACISSAGLTAVKEQLPQMRCGDKMDLNNYLVTLSQTADAERPSLFPFPFSLHLIFVIVCVVFFAFRFTTQKKPFQLLMCIAAVVSMGLWLSDSRAVYYGVGAMEAVLIIGSFITSLIFRDKPEDKKNDSKTDDDSDDNDSSDDDYYDEDDEDAMTAINAANTVNNILNN